MKTTNMRVNTPVIRAKIEFNGDDSFSPVKLSSLVEKIQTEYFDFKNIRVLGVNLRAQDLNSLGEKPVEILGRSYFAMFKSNQLNASVNTAGHILRMWQEVDMETKMLKATSGNVHPIDNFLATTDAGELYIANLRVEDEYGKLSRLKYNPEVNRVIAEARVPLADNDIITSLPSGITAAVVVEIMK